ncbi:MAG: response regulator [Ignavibacteria bacterium]|nr:response regulator [Ignavibacteria bacterium]
MITEKILVVDDESTICDSVKKILSRKGFLVENSLNADQAIEMMKANNYDLLITDLMMPKTSGIELIEMVKKHYPEIDVMVITGYASIETAVKATKLGALDYIPKPFTPDELAEKVQKAVEFRKIKETIKKETKTEKNNKEDKIDVDMPFSEKEVTEATSKEYANKLTRSDTTTPARKSKTAFCNLGQRECRRLVLTGKECEGECPIVKKEKERAKLVKKVEHTENLMDVDMPFNLSELESAVGAEYLDCLDRSDWPRAALYGKKTKASHKALVIDDEPVVCQSLRKILSKQSFNVEEAFSSESAEKKLQDKKYDLIFVDLKMPGKDGMEMLLSIKAKYPNTPVIMITGYASIETAIEATKLGAYEFLSKPFTPEELNKVALEAVA